MNVTEKQISEQGTDSPRISELSVSTMQTVTNSPERQCLSFVFNKITLSACWMMMVKR